MHRILLLCASLSVFEATSYADSSVKPPPPACRAPGVMQQGKGSALGPTVETQPPYLSAPASPWLGVAGDKPAPIPITGEFPRSRTILRTTNDITCDAAHDHCLRECTWLLDQPQSSIRYEAKPTDPEHVLSPAHWLTNNTFEYAANGAAHAPFKAEGYVAYRTVPATKRLLRTGVLVATMAWPVETPKREYEAFGNWTMGTLESVDWKEGTLRLKGIPDPFHLSVSRIVVLRYREGGKVELLSGFKKDEIVVAANEVILPHAPAALSGREAGAQVGKDGRPISVNDTRPLDSVVTDCSPARDHCLRPWVWFVVTGDKAVPARFVDGKFREPINDSVETGPAYRSVPATKKDLKVGARVIAFSASGGQAPGSESNAHGDWRIGVITEVFPDGSYHIDADSNGITHSLVQARIPVLALLPGEDKVEKL